MGNLKTSFWGNELQDTLIFIESSKQEPQQRSHAQQQSVEIFYTIAKIAFYGAEAALAHAAPTVMSPIAGVFCVLTRIQSK